MKRFAAICLMFSTSVYVVALELPAVAPQNYLAQDPWQANAFGAGAMLPLRVGHTLQIQLKPFEVRTLDAEPIHAD